MTVLVIVLVIVGALAIHVGAHWAGWLYTPPREQQ